MIKLEKTNVYGWEAAIRGMRNPLNSWDKSDSTWGDDFCIGHDDHRLMVNLAKAGPVHAKYRRMITVTVDITAPLYWWKEFDTYKVGTVANSCSTMHKIHAKEFTLDDFSTDHLTAQSLAYLESLLDWLNRERDLFLNGFKGVPGDNAYDTEPHDKNVWYQMIQLLPSSYNQKRTVLLNYEVLAGIYKYRKDHKLDEWHVFCDWIESLPFSEIIIM